MSFGSQSIRSERMPGADTSRQCQAYGRLDLSLGLRGVHRTDIQGMVTVSAFSSDAARGCRSCAQNFRCPQVCRFLDAGMRPLPRTVATGVQKAPRHEVAGSTAGRCCSLTARLGEGEPVELAVGYRLLADMKRMVLRRVQSAVKPCYQ